MVSKVETIIFSSRRGFHFAREKEAKKHVYKTSDVIVEQGDASDSMFIIIEGVVKVVVENDKGSSKVVGTLTVGESSLLTGASRSATVSATRPVVLYEIMKDSMKSEGNEK